MKAPKQYAVLNLDMRNIIENKGEININADEIEYMKKLQGDNMLFRQIRLVTGDDSVFNKYIVFVECKRTNISKEKGEGKYDIANVIHGGMWINGEHYVISESSSSMTRNAMLSFIREDIFPKMNEIIKMGNNVENVVISKYRAYRGLLLSSCFNIEGYMPKIIVIDEMEKTLPNVKIRYLADEENSFTNEQGELITYKKKVIKDGVRDIKENCFDGCGIMSPVICDRIAEILGIGNYDKESGENDFNSGIFRLPYLKGCVHRFDYTKFYHDRGVEYITDLWGVKHSVDEPMMIIDKSMYKGYNYFKKYGDSRDWDYYLEMVKKYNYALGLAKYNFSSEDEKYYTRGNYQILQDLDLEYDDFKKLSDTTMDFFENVMDGKIEYMLSFIGILAGASTDKGDFISCYTKAINKNYKMLGEEGIRNNIKNLIKGYVDDSKAGKIWLKGCFRFTSPDLVAFAEHAGGLESKGCLGAGQIWTSGKHKYEKGKEYLLTRNPHITSSEHDIAVIGGNDDIDKYINGLQNVCMMDMYSPHMARLQGCDFDGDLVCVLDEPTMIKGVNRDNAIVMDVDDKITVAPVEYNEQNIANLVMMNLDNRIGEYSNYSTCYHNKMTKTDKSKKLYDDFIATLSVLTGKEIDRAKTGIRYNLPKQIAKWAKPLPYFMKYAGEHYAKMNDFNKYQSNMNRLCYDIEKWENPKKNRRTARDFDYHIMIDDNVEVSQEHMEQIEKIYKDFNKTMRRLKLEKSKLKNYDKNKEWIKKNMDISKKEAMSFDVNWKYYYNDYKKQMLKVTSNKKEIVNCLVKLCYEVYPKSRDKIIWAVAGEWVADNIKDVNSEVLERRKDGSINILGEGYEWTKKNNTI